MKMMNILGLKMQCLSYDEMFSIFDCWLSSKESRAHSLAVINVHICVTALSSRSLRNMYNAADLIGIDSMPFLMWARTFYNKKSDRFYAPDLLVEVSKKAKEKGYTYFLYGGYPGAPEKIETFLHEKYEGIKIVGKYSPPFRQLTDKEDEEICKMINTSKADFLWVGLGSPKQDIWIDEHRNKLKECIIIPSGATFDFFSGRIKQAPKWLRNLGFEWLFRLFHDFKRLWKRYTLLNVYFVFMFLLQLFRIVTFDKEGYLCLLGFRTRFGNSDQICTT